MVIAPTTATRFNLDAVPYLKGKSSDQISTAAAVQQPNHAEMVKSFTDFIDSLINLEVGKLQTATSNSSDAEAQQKAQVNLDKYNAAKDSTVAPFVRDVADELAKHVFTVKELLVQDGLAIKKADGSTQFLDKAESNLNNSVNNLAEQALESVKNRLSGYGINIDTGKATELQKEIIQELKKPPEPKSETPEVTTEVVTQATSDASQSNKASTADDIENFVKSIRQASPALANLSKSRKGLEVLSQRIDSISEEVGGGAVDQATLEKFQNTIFPNLADEKKFTDAVSELSQGEKATLKTILCAVHGQADKNMTCNEMGIHARNINKGLGATSTSLRDINDGIDNLIKSHSASDSIHNQQPDPDRLKIVNKMLKTFEEELKKAGELSSAAEKVTAREEAQKKLLNELKESLDDNLIDVADLKMLKEVLAKPDSANSNYNERANKFLKDLNISNDDLKQWGSMAAMLAVGLMIFCPKAITGVMHTGTGLLNMTLGNGILPLMLMNHFGGDTKQGMNPLAAIMMMRNNNQASKAA
ncbi:MAG: hypothetical protein VKK32_01625 [Candidatus Melainabacteria bacterium]|nr:hypothetical protein [Candidatus Melainabacteria bacterium]